MKYEQLREKALELDEFHRKQLFIDLLRSIKQYERRDCIPDDICPDCLENKDPNGRCWGCYESGPEL